MTFFLSLNKIYSIFFLSKKNIKLTNNLKMTIIQLRNIRYFNCEYFDLS